MSSSDSKANRDTPRGVIRSGGAATARATPDELAATGAVDTSEATTSRQRAGESVAPSTVIVDAAETAVDPLVGACLAGRYLIKQKVGQGGMGAVYEATHTSIGKRVAVKVLLEKFAKRDAIVARLEQEARLASSIGHEHIIDITDFGSTDDGRTFVVMEYLEGESLADCLQRQPQMAEQRILQIVHQAASALGAAHEKGIVHRDIKPENLFLMQRRGGDFVKVLDFGISKSLRASDPDGVGNSPRLTQTGMVLGTPLYMSPEQARGDEQVDAGVDIYALGVIMYEAAAGRVPFSGNNYLAVISQVLNDEPAPLHTLRPQISAEFEAIAEMAMAKRRADRYPSAMAMADAIAALLDDPTRSGERTSQSGRQTKSQSKRRADQASKHIAKKYAIWVGAMAGLVAVVAIAVSMTMGSRPAVASKQLLDAAPALLVAPPPDASNAVVVDAKPPDESVKITIESTPPGAVVWEGNRDLGTTPYVYSAVKGDRATIALTLELEGYQVAAANLRPLLDAGKSVQITLKKASPGAVRKLRTRTSQDHTVAPPTSDMPPKNTTGGELNGLPAHLR